MRHPEHIREVLERIHWRTGNDGDAENERYGQMAATSFEGQESLTQQHFTEDADVNTIARRYGLDKGPMPFVPQDPRYYGDLSDVPDLRTALDIVRDAENRFRDLPPKLRERFDNMPGKLWQFVNDPDNADEAVRLGLLTRPAQPAATPEATPATPVSQQVTPTTPTPVGS